MEEAATHEKELETQAFRRAKTRIKKSSRVAADLRDKKAGEPYSEAYKQREAEVRQVEMKSEQGEPGRQIGKEELVIDARGGYQEKRFAMKYTSTRGTEEPISEELVAFIRAGTDGQPEFLKDEDGKTIAFNAELYDAKLTSQKHAQGTDYDAFTIPRIGGQGEYTGVVTLFQSKQS